MGSLCQPPCGLGGVSGRNAGVKEGAVAMKTKCPLQCLALSSTVTFFSLCHAPGQLGVARRVASLVTDSQTVAK